MIRPSTSRLRVASALLAPVLALSIVACGSSGSETTGSQTATSAGASTSPPALSGEPVVIGGFGAASGPGSNPELPIAIEAAVDYVNDNGGVGGRPLEYRFCDDENSQTVATNCATKLIKQDRVIALVGLGTYFASAAVPVLEGTDVPIFGQIGNLPGLEDLPNVFPVHPLASGYAAAAKTLAEKTGATKAAIVAQPGGEIYSDMIKVGFTNGGVDDIEVISYPQGTTNFASVVQQIADSGAEIFASVQPPDEVTALLTATKQAGLELPYAACDCGLNTAAVDALSSLPAENVLALAFDQKSPTWQTYLDALEKYAPGKIDSPYYSVTSNAWVATYLFASQVADKVGEVTPTAVSAYLNRQTAFDTDGLTAPIDFSKPGTWSKYPNMRNLNAYIGVAEDGEEVQVGDEAVTGFKATPSGT